MPDTEKPERRQVPLAEFKRLKKAFSMVKQPDGSFKPYPKHKHIEHQRKLKVHAARKRRKKR